MAVTLDSLKSFSATWSPASVEEDLGRWSGFLAEHGVTWSLEAKERDFVDQLVRSGPARAGLAIELRLSRRADEVLAKAGDARRLCRQISSDDTRRWYVLSPEQRSALAATGVRFESGMEGPLRQLATIPITLGVYFAAEYACRRGGLDPNIAWIVALVVYVLTVRVVRGRWPLQPR